MSIPLQYDYIIAGAGCAGLSLVMHMIHSGAFAEKKILLIDQDPKQANDRTWCFWQKGENLFESVVYRQWEHLWFYGEGFEKEFSIAPYRYKMIRGIDFYDYCLGKIREQPNITIQTDRVEHVFSSDLTTGIMVNGAPLHSEYVFNSIHFEKPRLNQKQYWLWQHFRGWIIETPSSFFQPHVATLMDFRMEQQEGTTFCYVLPFSPQRALVEYTVFSASLLPEEQYDQQLKNYIDSVLKIPSYTILDTETGKIPMTNFSFSRRQNNIINIGTAGGQTKGSSGYTFNFIQKNSRALVSQLVKNGKPFVPSAPMRFGFYDSVLLNILWNRTLQGKKIFTDLFRKNPPQRVLKFLDNETSLREDLGIISSLPIKPFFNAALWQIS